MAHEHAPEPIKRLTTQELHGKLTAKQFTAHPVTMESADKKYKATIWQRPTPAGAMSFNDTLVTLEINGDVELFRWASGIRSLDHIIAGKAPPA